MSTISEAAAKAAQEAVKAVNPKMHRGFWGEFKEFISKGSVIDLAVGMVVGAAFTAIVTSFVNDIVMPLLGLVIGGINFSSLKWVISPATTTTSEVALCWGNFLNAVINFLAISFVVFLAIKAINSIREKMSAANEADAATEAAEAKPQSEVELLTEIRDALVNQK